MDMLVDKYKHSNKSKSKIFKHKNTQTVINILKNSDFVKFIVLSKNLENVKIVEYVVLDTMYNIPRFIKLELLIYRKIFLKKIET